MRVLAVFVVSVCVLSQGLAVEWQDDFNGGAFDQPWDFFADDGSINPPSHTDVVILNDALEIRGRDGDHPNMNLFVAGLAGLTSDPSLAFPDAVQLTATISPTMNHAFSTAQIVLDNSDVFLLARSSGASGYVLALDRDNGSFDLVRSDEGDPGNIAPGMIIPDFDQNASYVLRLTAEGDRIRGEVFDTSMNLLLDAYATDATYASGFAGLGAAINNNDDIIERTYATGRYDDVRATDENIVPMQPFFPSHRLDMRTPTSAGLNAVEVRDVGVGDIESVRWAINGLMAAAPEDRHEGTMASFDIHDPDNGAAMGDINSLQQPILTDMPGDDNDFIQLLSGSFEIADDEEGDYTFNFHTDDGFAMRLFYDGPGAGEDLVNVPFAKIGANGLITSDGGVAFPHDTGDSDVQAAVNLSEGTYSYEMAWFDSGGGAFAEVSTAAGDFVDDPGSANWVLLGDGSGLALIDGLGTGPADMPPTGIPGDYSGNGLVEQADLDLVLGNWGADAGDVPATWVNDPPEGFVDQAELDKVLGNWGSMAPGLASAAGVPEPASLALLIVGLAAGWVLKRRS